MMLTGYRAAQLHVIFAFPSDTHLGRQFPHPMAYVELFNPFPSRADATSGLFYFKRSYRQNVKHAAIVPLTSIHHPCHIIPIYSGKSIPVGWTSSSHLNGIMDSKSTTFTLNPFSSVLFHAVLIGTGSPSVARMRSRIVDMPHSNEAPQTSNSTDI